MAITKEDIEKCGWVQSKSCTNMWHLPDDTTTELIRAYPNKEMWIIKFYGESKIGSQGTVYWGLIGTAQLLLRIMKNTGCVDEKWILKNVKSSVRNRRRKARY